MSESLVSLQSLTPLDVKQLSREQKRQLLRQHREHPSRNAKVVLLLGKDLLAGGTGGMGSAELSCIYEQVLIAALDCGRVDMALQYLAVLQKWFGRQSLRVRHLEGLCLEADGKAAEAERLYRAILKDNPSDQLSVLRLSAMLKSEGKYQRAIELLETQQVYTDEDGERHTLLEVHRGDSLATYRELSNLYYLCEDYRMSLHYADEAMLFDGNNYLSHTRLAELYYIVGDHKRCLVEYAQSLRLNSHANNCRAAYGLWVTANEVVRQARSASKRSDSEQATEEAVALREWAEKKLLEIYEGSPMLSAVQAMLQHGA
ncbi:uncharacterized protein Tco025E_03485 [Trypanosoma conorhini]|uniref:ER membrane protein complex subunit 2 n=1 Tax=Trypanosoma conorhini TaxID=83891 RepID=A0A422PUJ5_9TRYP|nr:uncharacterized protein Tco025E_03485 [Trypanosoma conorhini]RNF21435.1 hypothetical protein Tco025E_03485 [Trypanosoma conorhini]